MRVAALALECVFERLRLGQGAGPGGGIGCRRLGAARWGGGAGALLARKGLEVLDLLEHQLGAPLFERIRSGAILTEAGLSFLNMRDPNVLSWGGMIGDGRDQLRNACKKLGMTTLLTRIMFPYLVFISLAALAMGILNSMRAFAAGRSAKWNTLSICGLIRPCVSGGNTSRTKAGSAAARCALLRSLLDTPYMHSRLAWSISRSNSALTTPST